MHPRGTGPMKTCTSVAPPLLSTHHAAPDARSPNRPPGSRGHGHAVPSHAPGNELRFRTHSRETKITTGILSPRFMKGAKKECERASMGQMTYLGSAECKRREAPAPALPRLPLPVARLILAPRDEPASCVTLSESIRRGLVQGWSFIRL